MNIQAVQKKGYLFIPSICNYGQYTHIFCGNHKIIGADCPNCKKKLLRFLSIDMRDPSIEIDGYNCSFLHLLYCWTCNISQEVFFYKLLKDNEVKVIKYGIGGATNYFPYQNYPSFFPKSFGQFKPLSIDQQNIIKCVNSGKIDEYDLSFDDAKMCMPDHQIGGEPYLIQKEFQYIKCVECGSYMMLLGTICDKCWDQRGFTGNNFVQVIFYFCSHCMQIAAIQHCD